MPRLQPHVEKHYTNRVGWLRAAVLGANDGILSTASLILGVASASGTHSSIFVAGLSGLVAGAMSMAAGEYVSVSSQSDSEQADIRREQRELKRDPSAELDELTDIYVQRGLERPLAGIVAKQLMDHDALAAHARDELGISEAMSARPVLAALSSAASFAIGGAIPLLIVVLTPSEWILETVPIASLLSLASLGALGAAAGGANRIKATIRVTFWGSLAMGVTAAIGAIFGTTGA